MSNAKHTPGPWSYEDNPYGHDAIHSADGRLIAHVFGDDAQAQADARLIAAAPELLEALRLMLDQFNFNTITGIVHDESAAIVKARAAIAKAPGEQA